MPIQDYTNDHHQNLSENSYYRIKISLEFIDELVHKELTHCSESTEYHQVSPKTRMGNYKLKDRDKLAQKETGNHRENECHFIGGYE